MRISDWSSDGCSSDLSCSRAARKVAGTDIRPFRSTLFANVDRNTATAALVSDFRPLFADLSVRSPSSSPTGSRAIAPARRTVRHGMKPPRDRKRVGQGKSVSVRVDVGVRRLFKKKKKNKIQ